MMVKLSLSLLLLSGSLTLVMFISCASDVTQPSDEGKIITLAVECGGEVGMVFDSLVSEHHFIKLQTPANAVLGKVWRIDLYDSLMFILDIGQGHSGLYCFDREGKWRFSIDKKGRGPGEFQMLSDFSIDRADRRLFAFDPYGKVLVFDLEGNYLSEIQPGISLKQIQRLPGKKWLVKPNYGEVYKGNRTADYRFLIMNDDLTVVEKQFMKGNKRLHNMINARIFMGSADRFSLNYGFVDTIFHFRPSAEILPYLSVDFGNRKLPRRILEIKDAESFEELISTLEPVPCGALQMVSETDQFLSCLYWNPILSQDFAQMLYAKATGQFLTIRELRYESAGYAFSVPHPTTAWGDHFVSAIPAHEIEVRGAQGQRAYGASDRLSDFRIEESDNPVLVLMKYKPF